jgi:hypothetical protein
MQEEQKINWQKEADKLKEAGDFGTRNWWRPMPGVYKIKILSDGEKYEYDFEQKDQNGNTTVKKVNKIRLETEITGQKYDWGVTVGVTRNSLYGQLVLIAKQKGTLINEEITLSIKGMGKQRTYIIKEAAPLVIEEEFVV